LQHLDAEEIEAEIIDFERRLAHMKDVDLDALVASLLR
jgi:hypothetical protein